MDSVGFVGFGEAARCFSAALRDVPKGVGVYCAGGRHHPPYDEVFLESVAATGARAVNTLAELVDERDVIVSAVTVDQAEHVGREVIELARPGQLVVDINASVPSVKGALAELASGRGVRYVDASVMGAVSIYGPAVLMYASGEGDSAAEFATAFGPYGFTVEALPGVPTTSSVVKTLRSVVTKGMEALIVEAFSAARALDVLPQAFRGVCDPMDATTYSDFAVMCVKTDVLHSGRRAQEMRDIAAELETWGVGSTMTQATATRLEASAALGLKDEFGARDGYRYEDVLDAYESARRADKESNGKEAQ